MGVVIPGPQFAVRGCKVAGDMIGSCIRVRRREKSVLTFNDILRAEEIVEPVLLVRHQDARLPRSALYDTWRTDRDRFEGYQRLQVRERFAVGELLASFVVTPRPRSAKRWRER